MLVSVTASRHARFNSFGPRWRPLLFWLTLSFDPGGVKSNTAFMPIIFFPPSCSCRLAALMMVWGHKHWAQAEIITHRPLFDHKQLLFAFKTGVVYSQRWFIDYHIIMTTLLRNSSGIIHTLECTHPVWILTREHYPLWNILFSVLCGHQTSSANLITVPAKQTTK